MTGREWKPGDVAMRTTAAHLSVRDEQVSIASRCHDDRHDDGLHWHHVLGGWDPLHIENGPTYRPLVVIDPEDRDQVERLIEAIDTRAHTDCGSGSCRIDQTQAALRDLANPPPPPPKPEEPTGLGAVVEDAKGLLYVRVAKRPDEGVPWRFVGAGTRYPYAAITAVRILSEGVTA